MILAALVQARCTYSKTSQLHLLVKQCSTWPRPLQAGINCSQTVVISCETWSLSPCDEKRVDVAWNNAFRKIFNAYWHESVKPLLLSSCVHLVTHEETVILEENAM